MIEVKFLTRFIDITGERTIQIEDLADIKGLLEYLCRSDTKMQSKTCCSIIMEILEII